MIIIYGEPTSHDPHRKILDTRDPPTSRIEAYLKEGYSMRLAQPPKRLGIAWN